MSFNDKVCRTSFLPQSDPVPRTITDVYEAAHVTRPRVAAYKQLSSEVAERLERMQAHTVAMDAEMGQANPSVFSAVQASAWEHPIFEALHQGRVCGLVDSQADTGHLQGLGVRCCITGCVHIASCMKGAAAVNESGRL